MKIKVYMLLLTLLVLVLGACTAMPGGEPAASETEAGATPDPNEPVSSDDPLATPTRPEGENLLVGEAMVESINILFLESFPLQVHVHVKGYLADGCTTVGDIIQTREGNTFRVTVQTNRPADAICTMALVAFEETVPLDVHGLAKGTYTVDVNGVNSTFTLDVDNVLPGEETGELPLAPADVAEIIRLTLERALVDQEIPDYSMLVAERDEIALSTENIDPELVPELPGITLVVLTPEEIQAKANAEGDFLYLRFQQFEAASETEATVSLSNTWMRAENSEMLYLSGGGFTIEYSKTADGWTGEVTTVWIS